jgi:hypothetical protein
MSVQLHAPVALTPGWLLNNEFENYYYYYLLTAIGLMSGGSVYKGYTVNKEHSTPVSRKDDTYI